MHGRSYRRRGATYSTTSPRRCQLGLGRGAAAGGPAVVASGTVPAARARTTGWCSPPATGCCRCGARSPASPRSRSSQTAAAPTRFCAATTRSPRTGGAAVRCARAPRRSTGYSCATRTVAGQPARRRPSPRRAPGGRKRAALGRRAAGDPRRGLQHPRPLARRLLVCGRPRRGPGVRAGIHARLRRSSRPGNALGPRPGPRQRVGRAGSRLGAASARSPKPRSTSSAFSPSVPRPGRIPSWVAASYRS